VRSQIQDACLALITTLSHRHDQPQGILALRCLITAASISRGTETELSVFVPVLSLYQV
jgi:hypothetical protein